MSTATIRVVFGTGTPGAGSHLSAEIDDRESGLNAGKTSFAPGDQVWFLVYKSDNVEVADVIPSAGSISSGTPFEIELDQEVVFAEEDTSSVSVPSLAIISTLWYGRDLGTPTLLPDKMTVKVPTKGVGVCKLKVRATAYPYMLQSPLSVPDGAGGQLLDFSIVVVVKGNVVASP